MGPDRAGGPSYGSRRRGRRRAAAQGVLSTTPCRRTVSAPIRRSVSVARGRRRVVDRVPMEVVITMWCVCSQKQMTSHFIIRDFAEQNALQPICLSLLLRHISCLDQELISFRYSSCCFCWATLFKKLNPGLSRWDKSGKVFSGSVVERVNGYNL